MRNIYIILFSFIVFIGLISCKKREYTPKPRGYFRIDLPEKSFHKLQGDFPYLFEYPKYAVISRGGAGLNNAYWLNVEIPSNRASIHISYKQIDKVSLGKVAEESRELAYKHSIKADAIEEKIYINPQNRVYGTLYQIKGNAASPIQFYMTDSVKNFLRGSLYIREVPNIDSLEPVISFLEKDVIRLVETLEWKEF